SKILRLACGDCSLVRRLRGAVRAGVIDKENVDSMMVRLLQKRTDSAANNVSFIPGGDNHGYMNRICVHILRWNCWINAPEAAAREHEIHPDEKAENSGSNEHFGYCTAFSSRAGIPATGPATHIVE